MRKLLLLPLAAALLLPLAATTSPLQAPSYTALFCPEEWIFLLGGGATDMKGNCAACGKYPLELEVQQQPWFWCTTQRRWLQEPCKENFLRHCDLAEESVAVVTRPGPGLLRAFYCPEHRSFNGVKLPLVGVTVCAENGKPMAWAWATSRTWFWCELEGVWAAAPCPMNPVKHCCARHEGLLLATPETGPYAQQYHQ
jgi:hypothetical protein